MQMFIFRTLTLTGSGFLSIPIKNKHSSSDRMVIARYVASRSRPPLYAKARSVAVTAIPRHDPLAVFECHARHDYTVQLDLFLHSTG